MGTWTHPALAAADCPLAAKTLWNLPSTGLAGYRAGEYSAKGWRLLGFIGESARPAFRDLR